MVWREETISPPLAYKIQSDWTHLIVKLRWMGWDEEAHRLELAVSTLPPEMRCGRGGPLATQATLTVPARVPEMSM